MRKTILTIIAITAVFPFGISRSAIVKCRDASGQWHYGDAAGRACSDRHSVYLLNRNGIVVQEIGSGEDQRKAAEQTKAAQAHADRDRRLLATYSGPDDIKRTRSRRLRELERDHESIKQTLLILEQTLARMQTIAALSPPPPTALEKDIQETKTQIAAQRAALDAVEAKKTETKTTYDQALKRYRELKSVSP